MQLHPDEADARNEFHEMGLADLVDAWEEPMSDAVRALLLAELEERNYRVKSLPGPPPSNASLPEALAQVQRAPSEAERSSSRVRRGVRLILLIAVLQLLVGGYFGLVEAGEYSRQFEELRGLDESQTTVVDGETFLVGEARIVLVISKVLAIGMQLGLGCAFFALYFWARTRPRPALLMALMLYLGSHGLYALADPASLSRGILLKGMVVAGLVFGIVGTTSQDRERSPKEDLDW